MSSEPSPIPISDITTPVWPRRASKACASCRRDKIRCDGSRPCNGCTKKGYATEQCIDGCENCRRARVRCEDGKPCLRCRESHLDCLDESPTSMVRQDASTTGGPPKSVRPHGPDRAKLACQNCRRDNKKCDDQRPCSRCVARSEKCVHVGRGPKLVKLRCEGCRQENKKCEDARPCKQCIEQGNECVSVPRKGKGHGTRVKAACASCRRDKIRCDGVRPCSSCTRKGYECVDRIHKEPTFSENDELIETGTNAQASSSRPASTQLPSSETSTSTQQDHTTQNASNYAMPHFFYAAPAHVPPTNMMLGQMYIPEERGVGFFPIVDPHIEDQPRG